MTGVEGGRLLIGSSSWEVVGEGKVVIAWVIGLVRDKGALVVVMERPCEMVASAFDSVVDKLDRLMLIGHTDVWE